MTVQTAPQPVRGPVNSVEAPSPALTDHPGLHGITAALINERWDDVLRVMSRYSKTSPDVMKYFRAQRVEGNVAHLVTENETYYKRIQPFPEKRQIIERALARFSVRRSA